MASETGDASWRLFLGLWPPPQVREALAAHGDRWSWPAAARRTGAERLHITLHFLGNVPASRVPALRPALDLPWEGCTLHLDRAAVWPGGIAVLEASQVPPPLAALQARLGAALEQLGFEVETRRYRPHVTLARKAQGAQPAAGGAIAWQVGKPYLLLRSLPGGRGYQPLQVLAG